MTSGHDQAEPATIKPVNLMKIADKKESMAFKDNIEHLEALEYSVARFSKKFVCSAPFSISSIHGNGFFSTP